MLAPAHTLRDFLPPKSAISIRAPVDGLDWLPRDAVWLERYTGVPLPVAGDIPVVCHEAVVRPEALDLMAKAGLALPDRLVTYASQSDFEERLRELAAEDHRVYLSHPEPNPILAPDRYVVPMPVMRRLHDKAHLADIVPAEALPDRRILSADEFGRLVEDGGLRTPIVVKASAPLGSGAGIDVRICETPEELAPARQELAAAERLVVERRYHFRRTVCLNYGIGSDGVSYLGAAEQICDSRGAYSGNWLGVADRPEAELVESGRQVADAGRALGYRGILGVDAGLNEEGRPVLFDANFRINGCTTQVLLSESIATTWSRPCSRNLNALFRGDFADMIEALHRGVASRSLVPLMVFDASALPDSPPHPRCMLLIAGDSREDVGRRLEELRGEGFEL